MREVRQERRKAGSKSSVELPAIENVRHVPDTKA